MMDIVDRLRDYARDYTGTDYHDALINEGAYEIIRLRQQVQELEQQLGASQAEWSVAKQVMAEAQAREAKLREALEQVKACKGIPSLLRICCISTLALPQDDTALKEYRKQVLLDAAEWFDDTGYKSLVPAELRRMAEETALKEHSKL